MLGLFIVMFVSAFWWGLKSLHVNLKFVAAIQNPDEFWQAEEKITFWVKDIPNFIKL